MPQAITCYSHMANKLLKLLRDSCQHTQGVTNKKYQQASPKSEMHLPSHMPSSKSLGVALQVVTQHLTVGNPGHAVAAVTWTSSNPAVTVEPANASIAAGSEQQFQACVKGSVVGQLQAQLRCLLKHGMPQTVEVTARVTGEERSQTSGTLQCHAGVIYSQCTTARSDLTAMMWK